MSKQPEINQTSENFDYGAAFQTKREVCIIKKDGSLEKFNVRKVINAVGKSAYRALTSFTHEEKLQICQHVVDKIDELGYKDIPIALMHNIVESALEAVKPVVAKSYRDYRNYKQNLMQGRIHICPRYVCQKGYHELLSV